MRPSGDMHEVTEAAAVKPVSVESPFLAVETGLHE